MLYAIFFLYYIIISQTCLNKNTVNGEFMILNLRAIQGDTEKYRTMANTARSSGCYPCPTPSPKHMY